MLDAPKYKLRKELLKVCQSFQEKKNWMSLDPLSYLLSSSTLNVKRTNHFETTWFDQRVPSLLIFWRRTTKKKKKLTYVFRCDVELIYLLFFIPNGNRIAFASGEQHKRTQTDFTTEYNIEITFLLYPLLLPTTWYFTSSTTPRKKVMVEWVEVVKRRNRSKSGLKYHGEQSEIDKTGIELWASLFFATCLMSSLLRPCR